MNSAVDPDHVEGFYLCTAPPLHWPPDEQAKMDDPLELEANVATATLLSYAKLSWFLLNLPGGQGLCVHQLA